MNERAHFEPLSLSGSPVCGGGLGGWLRIRIQSSVDGVDVCSDMDGAVHPSTAIGGVRLVCLDSRRGSDVTVLLYSLKYSWS